jgi:hypothetical protein
VPVAREQMPPMAVTDLIPFLAQLQQVVAAVD